MIKFFLAIIMMMLPMNTLCIAAPALMCPRPIQAAIQRQNCKLANFDHHLLLVMLSSGACSAKDTDQGIPKGRSKQRSKRSKCRIANSYHHPWFYLWSWSCRGWWSFLDYQVDILKYWNTGQVTRLTTRPIQRIEGRIESSLSVKIFVTWWKNRYFENLKWQLMATLTENWQRW